MISYWACASIGSLILTQVFLIYSIQRYRRANTLLQQAKEFFQADVDTLLIFCPPKKEAENAK